MIKSVSAAYIQIYQHSEGSSARLGLCSVFMTFEQGFCNHAIPAAMGNLVSFFSLSSKVVSHLAPFKSSNGDLGVLQYGSPPEASALR